MRASDGVSEEEINCYLDGELDADGRERVRAAVGRDPGLATRLEQCRMINDLIAEAFTEPPRPTTRATQRRRARGSRRYRIAAAAVALLWLGGATGWLLRDAGLTAPPDESAPSLAGASSGAAVGLARSTVLHIDVEDPRSFVATLDRAESLLSRFQREGVRVEIVANSKGLNLLREDTSPHAERVRSLLARYDGLDLVACVNAVRRLQRRGIAVDLFDGTEASVSAVEHVADRVAQGWRYVKI